VYNVLLQIMDRGALTDTNGREANFKNVIVVMTTNIGAQAAARRTIGFIEQNHTTDAMEALKRAFTPEFRNRLDAIVQFNALDFEHILRVVDKFLIELEAQLQEKHVALHVDADARRWLAEHGFDPQMGARPMARVIQENVKRLLADELLFGKLAEGGKVVLSLKEDKLAVETEAAEKLPAVVE
jgi:ATP-dependent Clp protease ATP-binding subunit ClpA